MPDNEKDTTTRSDGGGIRPPNPNPRRRDGDQQQQGVTVDVAEYAAQIDRDRRNLPDPRAAFGRVGVAPPPAAAPVAPLAAADVPAPGAYYSAPSDKLFGFREIFASTAIPAGIVSYMARAADLTADANGDKILYEGTVMAKSGSTGMLKPREDAETAIGINHYRVNLRDADQPIGLIVRGVLREDRIIDDGVYTGQSEPLNADVIDALPHIQFVKTDL